MWQIQCCKEVNERSSFKQFVLSIIMEYEVYFRGRRGSDCIVVELTTTCAISAYHHKL